MRKKSKKSKAEQIKTMRNWFFDNYEDPAESCPYESAEGGYTYIWGGPYDAHDELSSNFEGYMSDAAIEELAEELNGISWSWSGKPSLDDLDPWPDAEANSDIPPLDKKSYTQAVLSATDWTTDTIVKQMEKGNILLNPRFQRRDAWTIERKSQFIESLILGLPVPQLVLAERIDKKGAYIVIDGKQRLLSIRQFAQRREVQDQPSGFNQLKLCSLNTLREIQGLTFADMDEDPRLEPFVTAFENQTIRTVVIRNWTDENFLYLVFLRLNTGGLPLAPQELRQALHPGEFIDFVDEYSERSKAVRQLLKLKKADFRMRDVELLVRYFGLRHFLNRYSGNLKSFLDLTCLELNNAWPHRGSLLVSQTEDLETAFSALSEVFGPENVCRKWTGRGYQSRFNRALFDVFFYYFSVPGIRLAASRNASALEEGFKKLCIDDSLFLRSVEQTTKSVTALRQRFESIGELLSSCLNIRVPIPQIGNYI